MTGSARDQPTSDGIDHRREHPMSQDRAGARGAAQQARSRLMRQLGDVVSDDDAVPTQKTGDDGEPEGRAIVGPQLDVNRRHRPERSLVAPGGAKADERLGTFIAVQQDRRHRPAPATHLVDAPGEDRADTPGRRPDHDDVGGSLKQTRHRPSETSPESGCRVHPRQFD